MISKGNPPFPRDQTRNATTSRTARSIQLLPVRLVSLRGCISLCPSPPLASCCKLEGPHSPSVVLSTLFSSILIQRDCPFHLFSFSTLFLLRAQLAHPYFLFIFSSACCISPSAATSIPPLFLSPPTTTNFSYKQRPLSVNLRQRKDKATHHPKPSEASSARLEEPPRLKIYPSPTIVYRSFLQTLQRRHTATDRVVLHTDQEPPVRSFQFLFLPHLVDLTEPIKARCWIQGSSFTKLALNLRIAISFEITIFKTDSALSHLHSKPTVPVLDWRNTYTSDEATRAWVFFLALRSTWLQQWPTRHARSRRR